MIVTIEDGQIKKIRFGNVNPIKGEIFFPYHWGTDNVKSFIKGIPNCSPYEINSKDPDVLFELGEII